MIKAKLDIIALKLFLKTDQKGTKVEHNLGVSLFLCLVVRAHNSMGKRGIW